MRFKVLKARESHESISFYINNCNILLIIFKQILRKNINPIKLKYKLNGLYTQPNINWTVEQNKIKLNEILNIYVANITCVYDKRNNICYFETSKLIKCKYSTTPIETIVRTLEYGGLNLQPLSWLRDSYKEFIEITLNTQNK